jgi:hypothetical protein
MKSLDIRGVAGGKVYPHKAEIASFAELADADRLANQLREKYPPGCGKDVYTFAAGMYHVVIDTGEYLEDTDVQNTNT